MAQGTPETVVYVSNAGSKEVFVLAMDRLFFDFATLKRPRSLGWSQLPSARKRRSTLGSENRARRAR